MCESTCNTLASSATNQGDNTVSVAQGSTAMSYRMIFCCIYIYRYMCVLLLQTIEHIFISILTLFRTICPLTFIRCFMSNLRVHAES